MFKIKKKKIAANDKLLRYAEMLQFGDIHIKIDHDTGLLAITAIHNTVRGPALGGCRMLPYKTYEEALTDVLRLAQMMSYKAAVCGLPFGGGKSVIIQPAHGIKDRKAFFEKFGDFVNELGGRYITAVDSGTDNRDMDIIATRTSYVTSTSKYQDPSFYTALGVRRGIEASVKFKLGRDDLQGIRVAIQGIGHVGRFLVKDLTELGAKITVADTNTKLVKHCVDEFKVAVVDPKAIDSVPCDVFAPCALGATISSQSIKRLKAQIVAGSANNQLAHNQCGQALHDRGILYAPDFVINSGGLIQVATLYDHGDEAKAHAQIYGLYQTLWNIFERSKRENRPSNEIAEKMALENLKG
jgi:leucine dehydrogenase